MPRNYDNDRPEKTWREKDRAKDRSSHRKADGPSMSKYKQARADAASRVYKSKLNSFFDGDGKAPDHIKDKLASLESAGGKKRAASIKKIKEAATSSAKTGAIAEFLKSWQMPPDYDFLTEVLACSDDDYIAEAAKIIEKLFLDGRSPTRGKLLEQRLRRIVTLGEDPKLQETAKTLIKKLRSLL